MKICGHAHSFSPMLGRGEVDLPSVIRFYRELDLDTVELADYHVVAAGTDAVRSVLAATGTTVACCDVGVDFVTRDPVARRAEVEKLQDGLKRAAELGARYTLSYPGLPREEIRPTDVRRWFAEGLIACLPLARRLGITMTIPDVGIAAELSGTSAHLNEICDAVGSELRVTYDIGNFLMAGEDPLVALDRVAPRVAHVHLKDWQVLPATAARPEGAFVGLDGRSYVGMAMGEGILDLPGVVS
ncbi:MAG TPA: sugar phosphate isomerase/epimerase family protein, partial [Chloroflexota bacterium]|nr:sugar phosphate isomerase/epimerase family protein [Chloroflexota bacterium]